MSIWLIYFKNLFKYCYKLHIFLLLLIKWLSKSDMIWLQDNTLKNCLNIGKIGSVRILLSTVCGAGSSDQHFYDIIIKSAQWFRRRHFFSILSKLEYNIVPGFQATPKNTNIFTIWNSCHAWFQSAKWFQGRRLKGETLTDDGHQDNDRRNVIAIAQTTLLWGEL